MLHMALRGANISSLHANAQKKRDLCRSATLCNPFLLPSSSSFPSYSFLCPPLLSSSFSSFSLLSPPPLSIFSFLSFSSPLISLPFFSSYFCLHRFYYMIAIPFLLLFISLPPIYTLQYLFHLPLDRYLVAWSRGNNLPFSLNSRGRGAFSPSLFLMLRFAI